MPRFRKKPVEIEAVQWTGENGRAVAELIGLDHSPANWPITPRIAFEMPFGVGTVGPGDWILRDANGDLCPCKSDIFEATYERV